MCFVLILNIYSKKIHNQLIFNKIQKIIIFLKEYYNKAEDEAPLNNVCKRIFTYIKNNDLGN